MEKILETAIELNEEIRKNRKYFHMYPEISNNEINTADKISKELTKYNIEYTRNVAGHGIVAKIGNGKTSKVIGFRADMDALQIQENSKCSYKSKNDGVMHACGHDAHMAILLGAARLLKLYENKLNGTVKLIFQPAEEMAPIGGSRRMIDSGLIDDLDMIFGLHMWPDIENGSFGIGEGAIMAASDHFKIEIKGKSSHAARPDDGIDTIAVGTQFIQNIQSIISRQISPLEPAVITIGCINAGTRYNILASRCTIEGTVRSFDEKVRDFIEDKLKTVLKSTCDNFDASYNIEYERGYKAVVNNSKAVKLAKKNVLELYGDSNLAKFENPSTIAEDFAFYLDHYPGAFLWFGCGGADSTSLHTDTFDAKDDLLWKASLLYTNIALDYLSE